MAARLGHSIQKSHLSNVHAPRLITCVARKPRPPPGYCMSLLSPPYDSCQTISALTHPVMSPPSPLAVLSSYILFFDSFCFFFYLSVVLLPLERSAVVSVRTPSAMRSTRCVIIICKMFLCRRGAHPSNRHLEGNLHRV